MFRTLACLAAAMTTTAVVLGWLEPCPAPASLNTETIVALANQAVMAAHLDESATTWDEVAIVASSEPTGMLAATATRKVAHFRIAANGRPTTANNWAPTAHGELRTIRIEVPQDRHGEPMTLAQWISVRALVSALQNSLSDEAGHPLPVRLNEEWAVVYETTTDLDTESGSTS